MGVAYSLLMMMHYQVVWKAVAVQIDCLSIRVEDAQKRQYSLIEHF